MKKNLLIIQFLFLVSCLCTAQTNQEASNYFLKGDPDSAFIITDEIIKSGKGNAETYVIAGRSLVSLDRYKEAIPYLEKVLTYEKNPRYADAWAKHDLGVCYFAGGDYVKSKDNLTEAFEMKATNTVTKTSKNSLMRFGFDELYAKWFVKETEHFVFHFMDTAVIKNVPAFVKRHEAAFDSLNKFFDSTLPKKIDFFVWSDSVLADSMLRKKLAFTEGALCLTHTMPGHTVGHEITHSLIAHALPITATTKLISEGTCVYFDLSMKDNLKMLRAKRPEYSVEDIWKGSYKVGDDILYPMGGELVKRLMALGGKEKFMKLLSNQTYENAVLIYGDEFKPMMKALQADIVKQEIKK